MAVHHFTDHRTQGLKITMPYGFSGIENMDNHHMATTALPYEQV